jgi:PKD repeat protein
MQVVPWPAPDEGSYTVALTVTDDAGTFTTNAPLVVDTTPPNVTVLSYRNMRFRVSEPATLTLVVGGTRYTRRLRKAATTQFWLRSKPTAYTLLATDPAGNTTRIRYRR